MSQPDTRTCAAGSRCVLREPCTSTHKCPGSNQDDSCGKWIHAICGIEIENPINSLKTRWCFECSDQGDVAAALPQPVTQELLQVPNEVNPPLSPQPPQLSVTGQPHVLLLTSSQEEVSDEVLLQVLLLVTMRECNPNKKSKQETMQKIIDQIRPRFLGDGKTMVPNNKHIFSDPDWRVSIQHLIQFLKMTRRDQQQTLPKLDWFKELKLNTAIKNKTLILQQVLGIIEEIPGGNAIAATLNFEHHVTGGIRKLPRCRSTFLKMLLTVVSVPMNDTKIIIDTMQKYIFNDEKRNIILFGKSKKISEKAIAAKLGSLDSMEFLYDYIVATPKEQDRMNKCSLQPLNANQAKANMKSLFRPQSIIASINDVDNGPTIARNFGFNMETYKRIRLEVEDNNAPNAHCFVGIMSDKPSRLNLANNRKQKETEVRKKRMKANQCINAEEQVKNISVWRRVHQCARASAKLADKVYLQNVATGETTTTTPTEAGATGASTESSATTTATEAGTTGASTESATTTATEAVNETADFDPSQLIVTTFIIKPVLLNSKNGGRPRKGKKFAKEVLVISNNYDSRVQLFDEIGKYSNKDPNMLDFIFLDRDTAKDLPGTKRDGTVLGEVNDRFDKELLSRKRAKTTNYSAGENMLNDKDCPFTPAYNLQPKQASNLPHNVTRSSPQIVGRCNFTSFQTPQGNNTSYQQLMPLLEDDNEISRSFSETSSN